MPPDEVARLRAIIETQSAVAAVLHDPARVLEMVMARGEELTGADGAAVEVVEDDDMVYRAVSGIVASMLGLRLDVTDSLSGLCVAEAVPLRCDETLADDRIDQDTCRRVGIRSMVVVPLLVDGPRPIGVLKIVSARPGAFDDLDLETLGAMAPFVATSLRDATDWKDLDRQVRLDPLTGLANRAALLERLTLWLEELDVDGAVTIHHIELDVPTPANDSDHVAGDRRLKEAAAALNSGVRGDDLVARVGGNELVVACRSLGLEDAITMAERLGRVARATVRLARSEEGDGADDLLDRAERGGAEGTASEREPSRRSADGSSSDAGT
jgi:diguanylate cyclase (GGDEF)-like protein